MMRRSGFRTVLVLALVAASALSPGSSAHSRELIRERFERVRPGVAVDNSIVGKDGSRSGFSRTEKENRLGRDSVGAVLDLPVAFDNGIVRGAISFDLQRKTGDVPTGSRTVFDLLDAEGRRLFYFQIQWNSDVDPRLPMVSVNSQVYWKDGRGLWPPAMLLDREVVPGQWIHLDFAWDDVGKKYALFVDGRSQNTSPNSYKKKRPPSLSSVPSASRTVNDWAPVRLNPPRPFVIRPFGHILSQARVFRIGVKSIPDPAKPYVAFAPLSTAVLDNFTVLVDEWPKGISSPSPRITSVSDDTFRVPGISGKMVAGDRVTVTLTASPGGKASFDLGSVKGIAMEEVSPTTGAPGIPAVDNGTYRVSYTIKPGDDFENGQIIGNFVSSDNVAAEPVRSASKWTIDTKPRITFDIDKKDLPADSSTKARIKLVAKDANGNPVKGRRLKLTLATTDEYTGTVGAGEFGKEVGAAVETRWRGETDSWGEVEFDYTAGFAAKTVILSAKDLDSGGVSVDYLTAYKEASIDIALTPPVSRAAARRGLQYVLKVEASRTELTADGRSRSVIRATLLDPNGGAVSGDPVAFTLSSQNGTLRTIEGTTNASGVATAEYIAGKKIGIVVVTATATLRNTTGNVSIILLSDAPAKIHLNARPGSLPADGFSRADLSVKVTDINDNPNRDTKVEFRIGKGGGKLEYPDRSTDRFGDTQNRYTAGTAPGIATVVATVRSKIPTDPELSKARNVLFVPHIPEGDTIRVERWLKKKGDAVLAGEPVLEYTVGRSRDVKALAAPYDLTLGDIFVEYWDAAEVGQTLATCVPAEQQGGGPVAPAPWRQR